MNIDEEYFKSEEFQEILENYEASINAGSTPFMDADDLVDLADYYSWQGFDNKAEAAANQVLQRTHRYPLRILHVALAARKLLDEIGVHQLQAEMRLKHTPDGNPVHCRALHRHLRHTVGLHHTTHLLQLKS